MDDEIARFAKSTADDVVGGGWGNAIYFTDPDIDVAKPGPIRMYGFKPPRKTPKVGTKIAAECRRSWVLFEVTDVDFPGNPPDMFFAETKVVGQIWKSGMGPR